MEVVEKVEVPEYTVILDDREDGIYEGATFKSYEEFNNTFTRWCAERNVRFTKLHSQTIEGANRWMKPGLPKYDLDLKYKSVFLSCVYADRKAKKGEQTDGVTFRKRGATGCPASVQVAVTRENMHQLVIKKLNTEHNHPPIPIEEYASSMEDSIPPSMVQRGDHRGFFPIPEAPTDFSRDVGVADCYQNVGTNLDSETTAPSDSSSPQVARSKRRGSAPRTSSSSMSKLPRYSINGSFAVNSAVPSRGNSDSSSNICDRGSSITLLQLLEAQPNLDEEDLFCRSLAIKLRTMNAQTRSRLKIQIQTLIHNAEFSDAPLPMHSKDQGPS